MTKELQRGDILPLDFAGYDLMCIDVDQDLINEYYLYLSSVDRLL